MFSAQRKREALGRGTPKILPRALQHTRCESVGTTRTHGTNAVRYYFKANQHVSTYIASWYHPPFPNTMIISLRHQPDGYCKGFNHRHKLPHQGGEGKQENWEPYARVKQRGKFHKNPSTPPPTPKKKKPSCQTSASQHDRLQMNAMVDKCVLREPKIFFIPHKTRYVEYNFTLSNLKRLLDS